MTSIDSHWAEGYVGKPWEACARGPESFDCYGLVWYDHKIRGIDIPMFSDTDPKDKELVSDTYKAARMDPDWLLINRPVERCVVMMSEDSEIWDHVGLYTKSGGGAVVHCYDGNCVHSTKMRGLELLGIHHIKYYKWDG